MRSDALDVLVLSWNFPPVRGGIETLVEHVVAGLRERGHRVRVVTAHAAVAPEPDVWRAPRPGLVGYLATSFLEGRRRVRSSRPDVLIASSIVSAPAAAWISGRCRAPWALYTYGAELAPRGWLPGELLRGWLRRPDRIVTISAGVQNLLAAAGAPMDRVVIIPPGADPPARPPPDAPDPYPGRQVLLSVGRLIRRKGVLEFVDRVMPELVRRRPGALLLVVGDDARASLLHHGEKMRAQIEAAIRARSLENHVRLLGSLPDVELGALYRRADLFVMPGLDLPGDVEGFGIVLVEAALAGVPALATRTGGIPDAVADGETGILTAPGDWTALVDAADRLLGDDELRRRMGRAAEARARREFVWPVLIRRHEEMLRSLVFRRGAG